MNMIERIRKKNKVIKAVIYARFSSDNQREESITAQIGLYRNMQIETIL